MARRQLPDDRAELGLCWGDARMSNVIFHDDGNIVGVLDWEQACLCPAEADFAWWLATRRQMLAVYAIDADPELPGFDSMDRVVGRYEEMIGRRLANWTGTSTSRWCGSAAARCVSRCCCGRWAGRPLPHPGTTFASLDRRGDRA